MSVPSVTYDGYCELLSSQKKWTDVVSMALSLSNLEAYSEGELTKVEHIIDGRSVDPESIALCTLKCRRCARSVIVGVPHSMLRVSIEIHCYGIRHPVVIAGEIYSN